MPRQNMQYVGLKIGPLRFFLSPVPVILLSAAYLSLVGCWICQYFNPSIISRAILVSLPVIFAIIRQPEHSPETEPYGNFHQSLNHVPGQNKPTEWLNMGYWAVSSSLSCSSTDGQLTIHITPAWLHLPRSLRGYLYL